MYATICTYTSICTYVCTSRTLFIVLSVHFWTFNHGLLTACTAVLVHIQVYGRHGCSVAVTGCFSLQPVRPPLLPLLWMPLGRSWLWGMLHGCMTIMYMPACSMQWIFTVDKLLCTKNLIPGMEFIPVRAWLRWAWDEVSKSAGKDIRLWYVREEQICWNVCIVIRTHWNVHCTC